MNGDVQTVSLQSRLQGKQLVYERGTLLLIMSWMHKKKHKKWLLFSTNQYDCGGRNRNLPNTRWTENGSL
jgi:hypothetical protein